MVRSIQNFQLCEGGAGAKLDKMPKELLVRTINFTLKKLSKESLVWTINFTL